MDNRHQCITILKVVTILQHYLLLQECFHFKEIFYPNFNGLAYSLSFLSPLSSDSFVPQRNYGLWDAKPSLLRSKPISLALVLAVNISYTRAMPLMPYIILFLWFYGCSLFALGTASAEHAHSLPLSLRSP